MEHKEVNSSTIKSVAYDPESQKMEVAFHGHDARLYRYSGVGPEKHKALMEAVSIGAHFHKHIKGKHACERVR